MQVNIEMWGGGIPQRSRGSRPHWHAASQNAQITCEFLSAHCVCYPPCSANSGREKRGRAGELEPKPPMDTPRWLLSWTQLGSALLTWTHLRSTAFRCRRGGCNNNPLALGGKETKDDEWHNYWTPASFESLKSVCFLRVCYPPAGLILAGRSGGEQASSSQSRLWIHPAGF